MTTSNQQAVWEIPASNLALPPGEVHVWRARLDVGEQTRDMLYGLLAGDERERAARFVKELDRDRYIASRGILRNILGRYLDVAPTEIEFDYTDRGKPHLKVGDLRFNLSHAADMALFAVAYDRDVGVDLEHRERKCDAVALAERFFAPKEVAELKSLPESQRQEGFFNAWTRKEAFAKCTGQGVPAGFDGFAVTLTPGQPAELRYVEESIGAAKDWRLESLNPSPDYIAAVCAEGQDWSLRTWEWEI